MRRVMLALATSTLLITTISPAHAATLVADWRMNETSGSTMFDSAMADGAQNGTIVGDVILTGQNYVIGTNGGAGYVTVPDDPVLNPGSLDLSFTAQFTIGQEPITTDFNVFRKGTGRQQHYKMELIKTRTGKIKARCHYRGSNGPAAITKGVIQFNTPYTLKCTKTATTLQLVLNGQTFTRQVSVGSITNTSALLIARNEDGDDQFIGAMGMLTVTTG